MTMHASGNSSIDTSLIRDIYCGPEVLFETCVATKFMDDDDDSVSCHCQHGMIMKFNDKRYSFPSLITLSVSNLIVWSMCCQPAGDIITDPATSCRYLLPGRPLPSQAQSYTSVSYDRKI